MSPENADKIVLTACVSVEDCDLKHRGSITGLLRHNISPFRWKC